MDVLDEVAHVERDGVFRCCECARAGSRLPGNDDLDRPRTGGRAGRAVGGAFRGADREHQKARGGQELDQRGEAHRCVNYPRESGRALRAQMLACE